MYRGYPQIGDSPEKRKQDWDQASNSEREKYIKAMAQWFRDYPDCGKCVLNAIYPVALKEIQKEVQND